jgi:hypothetical protein
MKTKIIYITIIVFFIFILISNQSITESKNIILKPTYLDINKTNKEIFRSIYFYDGVCKKDESMEFNIINAVIDKKLNLMFSVGQYKKVRYFKENNQILDKRVYVFKHDVNNLDNFRYFKMPFESGGKTGIVQDDNYIYILGEKYIKKNNKIDFKTADLFITKIDKKTFEFDTKFGNNGISIIEIKKNTIYDLLIDSDISIDNNSLFIANLLNKPLLFEINKIKGNIINNLFGNKAKDGKINISSLEVSNILIDSEKNLVLIANDNQNNPGKIFILKVNSKTGEIIQNNMLNLDISKEELNFFSLAYVNASLVNNKTYIGVNLADDKNFLPGLIVFDNINNNNSSKFYIFRDSVNDKYLNLYINSVRYYQDNYLFLTGGLYNLGYIKFDLTNPNNSQYFIDENINDVVIYSEVFDGKRLFLLGGEVFKDLKPLGETASLVIFQINNP